MLRWISTRKWFIFFHRRYHRYIENKIRPIHEKVILPIYDFLGGVRYEGD